MKPYIPAEEFRDRAAKAQALMKEQDIDLLFAYGNEAEPQYQKYFSNYWPAFETAAVMLAREGAPLLLVGPESGKRAAELRIIKEICPMAAFRESSSPEYNGLRLDSFAEVIDRLSNGGRPKKVAIAGGRLLPFDVLADLKENLKKYGEVTIGNDTIVDRLREIKSENEIACIRQACEITAATMHYLLDHIRVGMTELQIKGMALGKMYELGAEGEAFPNWVLSGPGTDYAIGRPRQKAVQAGEMIQLQIGARYEGYASTIARPVIAGRPEPWMTNSIQALYEGYDTVLAELTAGNSSRRVAVRFMEAMGRGGYGRQVLYGPCHGLGLMECEAPWIEAGSDFRLDEGMVFGMDLYLENPERRYGIRIEDTVCVTGSGPFNMTAFPREIFTF